MEKISRRRFLRLAGGLAAVSAGGTVATVLSGCTANQQATATSAPVPPATTATFGVASATAPVAFPTTITGAGFVPDVEIALKAIRGQVQILPGQPTQVWQYQTQLLKGDASALQPLENTYLGPIIRVRKGQKVRVHLTNDLLEPTIVHWHGVLVPSRMDGHPRDEIAPGKTYVYEYEVVNRAGTYWYHPHPHTLTGGQAYRGLAGLFLVSDDEEAAAGLPSGRYDVPLVIQDRTFDKNNQLVYLQGSGMGGMGGGMMGMDRMMGFLGERILVIGRPDFTLPVATRAYRLRLLNGSNSRVYKVAWSDGSPLTVIGTDGGLLEKPVQRKYVTLGPAERVELWADFGKYSVGTELTLQSLEFIGAEGDALMGGGTGAGMGTSSPVPGSGNMGMGGGSMMGGTATPGGAAGAGGTGDMNMGNYNPALPNGAAFSVMKVRVERQEQESLSLPSRLSTVPRLRLADAVNGQNPRSLGLRMRGMQWLLNGRTFKVDEVADNEVVKLNTVETWEFVNELNPGEPIEQMGMVHPMHIHGVQFQVVDRQVTVPQLGPGWDSVREGYLDEGLKDTVLVMPGERVKLLMRFTHPDLFVYHCHNLEHEDMGMMRNFRVEG